MTVLGKKDVLVEVSRNGILTSQRIENKVVYRMSDGTLQVSHSESGNRSVVQRQDGSYYQHIELNDAPKTVSAADRINSLLRGAS